MPLIWQKPWGLDCYDLEVERSEVIEQQLICRAILFDMDGVLLNSKPAVERQWAKWARAHGFEPTGVLAVAHGVRIIETIRRIAPHLDAAKEATIIEQAEMQDTEGLVRLPGAQELLEALPPDRWTIVTSATRPLAEMRLRFVGLKIPQLIVTADDVKQGKPHPEPYLAGAAKLGVKPEDCLVVEDAPPGVRAAKSAGMQALGLITTHTRKEVTDAGADAVVGTLADVRVGLQDGKIVIGLDKE